MLKLTLFFLLDKGEKKCYNDKAVGDGSQGQARVGKGRSERRERRLTEPGNSSERKRTLEKSLKKHLTKLRQCDII